MGIDAARQQLAFPLDYPDLPSARQGAERVHKVVGKAAAS